MDKASGAFLTIGELSRELGVAQHILRYWETRFAQLKPLQRSGNRRYYRPTDVEVARRIDRLLNQDGFTVRGAQRVLAGKPSGAAPTQDAPAPGDDGQSDGDRARGQSGPALDANAAAVPANATSDPHTTPRIGDTDLALLIARLTAIRDRLRDAVVPSIADR